MAGSGLVFNASLTSAARAGELCFEDSVAESMITTFVPKFTIYK